MTFQPDDVDQRHLDAIADAEQVAYWLDGAHVPDTNSTLVDIIETIWIEYVERQSPDSLADIVEAVFEAR